MANLKEVKSRIQSVTSTQQITKAMKMVAAAKLRRAQDSILQMRPYAQKLNTILQNVSSGLEENDDNLYGVEREVIKVLIIPITSDKGLCGAFNSNIFKRVTRLLEEDYASQYKNGDVTIMPLGKRSFDYYKKRNYNIIEDFADVFSKLSFENAKLAAEHAMEGFINEDYDKVEIVYNEFKNVATQIIKAEQFLPIVSKDIYAGSNFNTKTDYIYQPSKEVIIEEMIPKSLKIQLYKGILESNASENGARMTAMDKATDNAGELLKELKLTYNRTRQAAITKEILEIVGGAEALG
ncbi:MAG: ATP synthase F1 subunit gamma [Cyclobacteriaceae bacterium]|nr:ATP synthase F1 subunit gamma [Cyclobacteriaceae bacterium]